MLKPTEQIQTEECPLEQPQTEEQPLETTETVSTVEILDVNSKLAVNSFVTIKLETKKSQACYFAKVKSIDNDAICVEYLEKGGSKYYKYSTDSQDSTQNTFDIVCTLPEPEVVISGFRVFYVFNINEQKKALLKKYKCQ